MKLVYRKTYGPLPTSKFELVNDVGEVLGYTQIRHRASACAELPAEAGNHIYYEISRPYRGRGFGKKLMELALIEANRIGLDPVRLTVKNDNPTSRHIIESHGAVWLRDYFSKSGEHYHLFEVSVRK